MTRLIPSSVKRILKRILRGPGRLSGATRFAPAHHAGLRIECHTEWPDAPAVAAWQRLLDATVAPLAFQSPTWHEGIAKHAVAPGRLRLITVMRHADMIGVLPMQLTAGGTLESAGAAVSDYLDPLISAADESVCWSAILAFLRANWDSGVGAIALRNLRTTCPAVSALPSVARESGFAFEQSAEEEICVQIALPKTWDEYLAARPKDERIEFRRRLKKAETEAGAKLVTCEDPAMFDPALDKAISLMEARGGDKGEAVAKYVRPLLMDVGPKLMREGRLRLLQLVLNDTVAGALVSFPHPAGPMIYNTGFDLAHRVWGPGIVGSLMVMRRAIEDGQQVFDLLRGREEYKNRLGGVENPLYRLTLRPA